MRQGTLGAYDKSYGIPRPRRHSALLNSASRGSKALLYGGPTVVPYGYHLTSSDAQVRLTNEPTLYYSTAHVRCCLPPCSQFHRLQQEVSSSITDQATVRTVVPTVLCTRAANVPDGVAYLSKSLGLQLCRMDSCSTALYCTTLHMSCALGSEQETTWHRRPLTNHGSISCRTAKSRKELTRPRHSSLTNSTARLQRETCGGRSRCGTSPRALAGTKDRSVIIPSSHQPSYGFTVTARKNKIKYK